MDSLSTLRRSVKRRTPASLSTKGDLPNRTTKAEEAEPLLRIEVVPIRATVVVLIVVPLNAGRIRTRTSGVGFRWDVGPLISNLLPQDGEKRYEGLRRGVGRVLMG